MFFSIISIASSGGNTKATSSIKGDINFLVFAQRLIHQPKSSLDGKSILKWIKHADELIVLKEWRSLI
jgi:hypothetical protein